MVNVLMGLQSPWTVFLTPSFSAKTGNPEILAVKKKQPHPAQWVGLRALIRGLGVGGKSKSPWTVFLTPSFSAKAGNPEILAVKKKQPTQHSAHSYPQIFCNARCVNIFQSRMRERR